MKRSTVFRFNLLRFILILCLILGLIGCKGKDSLEKGSFYSMLKDIPVRDNRFGKRIFKNDLYELEERTKLPDYVGDIRQLRSHRKWIYMSDRESIYRFKNGIFEIVFTPEKGQGPNEVPQIFRFDIRDDDIVAIAGYPEARLLLHQLSTDTSMLIMTQYNEHVLIDKNYNFYGMNNNDLSGYMFCKFNIDGDSVLSMGRFFKNQEKSLNMFDAYWDYNEKYDLIVIGFMYVGYYLVMDTGGRVKYAIESFYLPGNYPKIVTHNDVSYMDNEGKAILLHLSTNKDEVHIFTAHALNKKKKIYGALIDVFDIRTGTYMFSYVLPEPLHWPILLLDDYSLVAITQNYDLVIWKRNQSNAF
ncbi:MAG: hypothetical protein Q9P90_01955 [candidate division KSB1 bacterium]|nr:hypothetical protein [candidate division KSB1 bacterium]